MWKCSQPKVHKQLYTHMQINWSELRLKSPERLGAETNTIKEQIFKVIRSP